MSENSGRPIDHALRRLWLTVTVCCWLVAAALVGQVCIWGLATFTDIRFEDVTFNDIAVPAPAKKAMSPAEASLLAQADMLPAESDVPPIRVRSRFDMLLHDLNAVSMAVGSLALFVLVIMVTVMVIITASASAPGVDQAVSALSWAIVVTALTVPIGGALNLPWQGSALRDYDTIVEQVELALADGAQFDFYAKFLAMPVVGIIGLGMIAAKFGRAARHGLPSRSPYLDQGLESEASDLSATSLYGTGRSSGALNRLVEAARRKEMAEEVAAQSAGGVPTVGQPSAGKRKRRAI